MKRFSELKSNQQAQSAQGRAPLRTTLFYVAALMIPVVLLLLAELTLRLAGVMQSERTLFVEVPDNPDYLAANPAYVGRYFSDFTPGIAFTPFRRNKRPDAFRVVVMGGSSAAGFPYRFNFSFPAYLQAELEASALGQEIEVVNLGMSAVNSYTLLDLAPRVAAIDPDAVVIYAGHNEYYGAFGVGSAVGRAGNRAWLKRSVLRLKHSALYLALEDIITPDKRVQATDRTLMARVVREATIDRDSELFVGGMRQFGANMAGVLRTFRKAGIPVFLGTVASNLAGQSPMGENKDAEDAYERGRASYDADPGAARRHFVEAKDLDNLRFRAPEEANAIIRELAVTHGAIVVDTEAALRAASRTGVEDDDLFIDHLHPNFGGYAVVAGAFAEALSRSDRLSANPIPFASMRPDPISLVAARTSIARLTSGYPFDKTITPDQANSLFQNAVRLQLASGWVDSLGTLAFIGAETDAEILLQGVRIARAQADTINALLLYRALLPWQPFNDRLMRTAVGFALASPNYDVLVAELARHAANRSGDIFFYNALAVSLLRSNELAGAEAALAIAESLDEHSPEMLYNAARLHVTRGDTALARSYFLRYRDATGQSESRPPSIE